MFKMKKTLEFYSCAFRQPFANHSHCSKLHGYGLSFDFHLKSTTLDLNNWVYDYGAFAPVKEFLTENFEHTTAIAANDPYLDYFQTGHDLGVLNLRVFDKGVGCERFADFVHSWAGLYFFQASKNRVALGDVVVHEHRLNSASYSGEQWS